MKVRKGFVSNSSSSSFILIFDKVPSSEDELGELLNFEECSKKFRIEEYVEQVFRDMREAKEGELMELFSVLSLGIVYDEVFREGFSSSFKGIEKIAQERSKELLKEFSEEVKGKEIRIVKYADGDGEFYSNLEHGNLFKNIESIRVSFH